MLFFPKWLTANANINRLAAHVTLHQLAWAVSGVFSAVFLFRQGLTPAEILLALAMILLFRFAMRPAVLWLAPVIGLRRTLMCGTAMVAVQYLALGMVQGFGAWLIAYCAIAAIGNVTYWTSYHATIAIAGDRERRGGQVGSIQTLTALTGIVGPAIGGALLTFGPWSAFAVSAVLELVGILPLLRISVPPLSRIAPKNAYSAAINGALLFASDGWITSMASPAWNIFTFKALGERYAAFGGLLAGAALAGALAGLAFGGAIDAGHARRAIWISSGLLTANLLLEVFVGPEAFLVIGVNVIGAILAGIFAPVLFTAVYNESKASPCPFRFQFMAEGGWDVGGGLASLVGAALLASQVPLQIVIALAIPAVAFQLYRLRRSYAAKT